MSDRRYNHRLIRGETSRLVLRMRPEGGAARDMTGYLVELRVEFRAGLSTFEGRAEGDRAIIDFGDINTSAWEPGRWNYQLWLLAPDRVSWREVALEGELRIERGLS